MGEKYHYENKGGGKYQFLGKYIPLTNYYEYNVFFKGVLSFSKDLDKSFAKL